MTRCKVFVLSDAQLFLSNFLLLICILSGITDTGSEMKLTGQLADKPTRGQSSRRLDNLRTGQLADSEFLKIMELLYFIFTLNLTLTLSNIGSILIV